MSMASDDGRWEPNAGFRSIVVSAPAFSDGDGHFPVPLGGRTALLENTDKPPRPIIGKTMKPTSL
jgi:hypothetical protein